VTRTYEAQITESSGRITEYGKRVSTCGDSDRMVKNNICVRISDSVSSLLSLSNEAALMQEDLAKKCSELSKENAKLKGI
jgi:hypothetical protein